MFLNFKPLPENVIVDQVRVCCHVLTAVVIPTLPRLVHLHDRTGPAGTHAATLELRSALAYLVTDGAEETFCNSFNHGVWVSSLLLAPYAYLSENVVPCSY